MKNQWKSQKNKYLARIYQGVLDLESASEIHKDLVKMTINTKKLNKPLLAYMIKLTNKAVKLEQRPDADVLLVSLLLKEAVNYKANILINAELRKEESKTKETILENSFEEGRKTGKIFYVASRHKDSAKDHKEYQGRIYVDAYYDRHNQELCSFIRRKGIRTVQWVTGSPVWFITRPNCRHYFRQYTFDEIKNSDYIVPTHKIGSRAMQTPAGVKVDYYKDRLAMLQGLYKVFKTQKTKDQILKTKILITKWEKIDKPLHFS